MADLHSSSDSGGEFDDEGFREVRRWDNSWPTFFKSMKRQGFVLVLVFALALLGFAYANRNSNSTTTTTIPGKVISQGLTKNESYGPLYFKITVSAPNRVTGLTGCVVFVTDANDGVLGRGATGSTDHGPTTVVVPVSVRGMATASKWFLVCPA